jgi:hypothetical protein
LRAPVFGIAEDRDGWLWLTTALHVVRVNREKLLRGGLGIDDFRTYGVDDGLRGTEGVKRHRSVVTDPWGRIWFSLNRGISFVDPARLRENSAAAIVHVQSILVDGASVDLRGPLRLQGGRHRVTFRYTGLSLSVPERVRYRYQLEGFDHAWNDPVATREAVYTNLAPGPYRFRVIASNADGVWSGTEDALAFAVDPL